MMWLGVANSTSLEYFMVVCFSSMNCRVVTQPKRMAETCTKNRNGGRKQQTQDIGATQDTTK